MISYKLFEILIIYCGLIHDGWSGGAYKGRLHKCVKETYACVEKDRDRTVTTAKIKAKTNDRVLLKCLPNR